MQPMPIADPVHAGSMQGACGPLQLATRAALAAPSLLHPVSARSVLAAYGVLEPTMCAASGAPMVLTETRRQGSGSAVARAAHHSRCERNYSSFFVLVQQAARNSATLWTART